MRAAELSDSLAPRYAGVRHSQPAVAHMRILFAIHNAYTDHVSGAARSMRTLM